MHKQIYVQYTVQQFNANPDHFPQMPLPLLFQRHGLFSFENYDAGAAGSAALPGGAVVRDAVATGIQDRRELLQLLEGAYTQFFVDIAIVRGFWQGASYSGTHPVFFTMLHHFLRAASGIRHQHGSGSDAAHPGIVPVFCAGMPYKHARRQCHFPAYCPILSA